MTEITEYFGAQEVVIFFLNNIFNYLKGNCVLRTLARSLAAQKIASLFFGRDGHTYVHTYIHTHTHTHTYLVFWCPRSFQFDLEMNINIYCIYYIIREDSQEVLVGPLFRV